jgi:type I restriction enzyme R subunit
LGYSYISLKKYEGLPFDEDTNILPLVFRDSLCKINDTIICTKQALAVIEELKVQLGNEDLGRQFYNTLIKGYNGLKLIDFNDSDNNTYNIVTELPYANGEFRPDITILINGLPLAFVEVKKPNNKDGVQAEFERMYRRSAVSSFKRFMNITQIAVFSNNSEYDDDEPVLLEGVFYSTTSSYDKLLFNHFREEDRAIFNRILPLNPNCELEILKDNNLVSIKGTPEYTTNISPTSPSNRILTSLFSRDRILFLLKYAFAFVEKIDEETGITTLEKHIMRYPQIFATKAIQAALDNGVKHGIIWHTQGSGKTALAYYNVRFLKDYYQSQGTITKFFFIVDRIALLEQAVTEFEARGLTVKQIDSKDRFANEMASVTTSDAAGEDSITVVNIQKFSDDATAIKPDYDVNIQRVFFLDEAHRSYNPKGSFLSNLISADRKAVMIALTGTPLIGNGFNTKDIFGNYIHKYYYNNSIADRYTLRLIREGIQTTYRLQLQAIFEELQIAKGSLSKEEILAHSKYTKALVNYITEDFRKSRIAFGDQAIGGMVVCDSSEQARSVFEQLQDTPYTSALILHDEDDKETRKKEVKSFKDGKLDFLVVYRMLLTGFDCPRLKKLYLGRVIKDHSLLQALTRVNRPYKKMRFGYVVDFADIRHEFDKTNKAYFEELQAELGDDFTQYGDLFLTPEEIEQELLEVQECLFLYNIHNRELFSQQVSSLDDKDELLRIRRALECSRELFNIAKLFGYDDLATLFNSIDIAALYNEVADRIALVNLKARSQDSDTASQLLNTALDQIEFNFKKVSESELVIADKLKDILEKARQEIHRSIDTGDIEFTTLLEELKRFFSRKNIEELTADEMTQTIKDLEVLQGKARQKNLKDQMLADKYEGDNKFMRVHKRLSETPPPLASPVVLNKALLDVKHEIDQTVFSNEAMMNNEPYFKKSILRVVDGAFKRVAVGLEIAQIEYIGGYITNEYLAERQWAS